MIICSEFFACKCKECERKVFKRVVNWEGLTPEVIWHDFDVSLKYPTKALDKHKYQMIIFITDMNACVHSIIAPCIHMCA